MSKYPDFNHHQLNPRSPHTIHSNSDRTKQIGTPDGYEFYNSQLIGPASKLTQRDRETILATHPFFVE